MTILTQARESGGWVTWVTFKSNFKYIFVLIYKHIVSLAFGACTASRSQCVYNKLLSALSSLEDSLLTKNIGNDVFFILLNRPAFLVCFFSLLI